MNVVPASFAHDDDQFALLNFIAYRVASAKTEKSRKFWNGAFDKLGGFDYVPGKGEKKDEAQ